MACAIGAAALFGVSTTLAKQLLPSVSPLLLAGLLYVASGLGLGAYRMARGHKAIFEARLVSDVPASLAWFESLGWKRGFTWNDGGMIEGAGARNADGVWMSWWIDSVPSLDELHATAVSLGYVVTMPPTNEPWGVREFHLRHPDGHMFRVSTGLTSRESRSGAGPP